ncbi:putative Lecithin:cholesterol/phospholipid:diacylglycerol acyltransferase [Blattamonas nauphoetae]|uniref:Lecithin:cholesterol/phospholipid:diacylglycerol acyltransferase n=1 Tax=Blattamonas nauphoetae TaxID=2049346 RepID=A0ABQ9YEY2_9EUKA|nr:putative Lecithin:cholesterol/phospholipid:diacylglycerol acyltransferase [Blattamonas nauphoetae]
MIHMTTPNSVQTGNGKPSVVIFPGCGGTILSAKNRTTGKSKVVWPRLRHGDSYVRNILGGNLDPADLTVKNPDSEWDVFAPDDNFGLWSCDLLMPNSILPKSMHTYYHYLFKFLMLSGYKPGVNLWGCPLDWRQDSTHKKLHENIQRRIEEAYEKGGRQRVTVITHSQGGITMKAFMQLHPDFCSRFIENWVALAGPFQGAGRHLQAYFRGYAFGVPSILCRGMSMFEATSNSLGMLWFIQPEHIPFSPKMAVRVRLEDEPDPTRGKEKGGVGKERWTPYMWFGYHVDPVTHESWDYDSQTNIDLVNRVPGAPSNLQNNATPHSSPVGVESPASESTPHQTSPTPSTVYISSTPSIPASLLQHAELPNPLPQAESPLITNIPVTAQATYKHLHSHSALCLSPEALPPLSTLFTGEHLAYASREEFQQSPLHRTFLPGQPTPSVSSMQTMFIKGKNEKKEGHSSSRDSLVHNSQPEGEGEIDEQSEDEGKPVLVLNSYSSTNSSERTVNESVQLFFEHNTPLQTRPNIVLSPLPPQSEPHVDIEAADLPSFNLLPTTSSSTAVKEDQELAAEQTDLMKSGTLHPLPEMQGGTMNLLVLGEGAEEETQARVLETVDETAKKALLEPASPSIPFTETAAQSPTAERSDSAPSITSPSDFQTDQALCFSPHRPIAQPIQRQSVKLVGSPITTIHTEQEAVNPAHSDRPSPTPSANSHQTLECFDGTVVEMATTFHNQPQVSTPVQNPPDAHTPSSNEKKGKPDRKARKAQKEKEKKQKEKAAKDGKAKSEKKSWMQNVTLDPNHFVDARLHPPTLLQHSIFDLYRFIHHKTHPHFLHPFGAEKLKEHIRMYRMYPYPDYPKRVYTEETTLTVAEEPQQSPSQDRAVPAITQFSPHRRFVPTSSVPIPLTLFQPCTYPIHLPTLNIRLFSIYGSGLPVEWHVLCDIDTRARVRKGAKEAIKDKPAASKNDEGTPLVDATSPLVTELAENVPPLPSSVPSQSPLPPSPNPDSDYFPFPSFYPLTDEERAAFDSVVPDDFMTCPIKWTSVDGDWTIPSFSASNDMMGAVAKFSLEGATHMGLMWDKRSMNLIACILGIPLPYPND